MKFTKEVRADNCFFLPSSLYSIVRMCSEGDELDETFESSHQTFFVGGPGRLDIRLFTALIRNTYTFFFYHLEEGGSTK